MNRCEYESPDKIQELGRLAVQSLSSKRSRLFFWRDPRQEFRSRLVSLVTLAQSVDPSAFEPEQFGQVDQVLGEAISKLENYFARFVEPSDAVTCYVTGRAISDLREAREWIAQGLSPERSKRPSKEESSARTAECALRVLAGIVSPEQPQLPIEVGN